MGAYSNSAARRSPATGVWSASVSDFRLMIARQREAFMVALKTLVFSILVHGTVNVMIPRLLLQGTGGLVLPIPSL